MKIKSRVTTILLLLFSVANIMAQQESGELNLSFKEAQDYAISNNKMVLAAKSDVMASKAAIWEAISSALPEVSASGSFTDNLKLMTTLLPGEFFGQRAGDRLGERGITGPAGGWDLGKERQEGQLRKGNDVGPLAGGLFERRDAAAEIILQVNVGVLLNEGDNHGPSAA